jgi:hypothetical protein
MSHILDIMFNLILNYLLLFYSNTQGYQLVQVRLAPMPFSTPDVQAVSTPRGDMAAGQPRLVLTRVYKFGWFYWISTKCGGFGHIRFLKNRHCSSKNRCKKLDSTTSDFLHSVEFLNTGTDYPDPVGTNCHASFSFFYFSLSFLNS